MSLFEYFPVALAGFAIALRLWLGRSSARAVDTAPALRLVTASQETKGELAHAMTMR